MRVLVTAYSLRACVRRFDVAFGDGFPDLLRRYVFVQPSDGE